MANMNWLFSNRDAELQLSLQKDELTLLQNYRKLEDVAQEEFAGLFEV